MLICDIGSFAMLVDELQPEFGAETIIEGLELEHLRCYGTTIAATVVPESSEKTTLDSAWAVIRRLAAWTLRHSDSFPPNERFQLIVGWSKNVRAPQGQIYKTGGTVNGLEVLLLAHSPESFDIQTGRRSLVTGWQKDVFAPNA